MAQNHLDACPSVVSGLSEDCSCDKEVEHYIKLAKISFGLFIFEFFGGLFSGSMALMADAFHVLADGTENIINVVVSKLSKKSDGEKRIRKVGGVISGWLLLLMGIWIVYEGWERFISPHKVGWYMTLVAFAGLCVNVFQKWLHDKALTEHRNTQHFWQSWHLWQDIAASVMVVVGGLFMLSSSNLYWIDGILSMAIGLLIVVIVGAKLLGFELHSHDHEHKHGDKCDHRH